MSSIKTLLAVGADPEVFFTTPEGPFSVEGLIGGTKRKPKPIPGLPSGFAIQEDNVAAEYNIPPSATAAAFSENIGRGLRYLRSVARTHKMKLLVAADADFPLGQLMTPHAMRLGCDPDFNVWTLQENPRPEPPQAMRTAAGHVHVSWQSPSDNERILVGRWLDVLLGVPSVLVTQPTRRRQLYGRAGAVRFKPYGIEYRVLDNFWITSQPLARHIFQQCQRAVKMLTETPFVQDQLTMRAEQINTAINDHVPELAGMVMQTFNATPFPVRK